MKFIDLVNLYKYQFVTDGYTTEDLVYVWGGAGGGFENGSLEIAEFHFKDYFLDDCTETYSVGTVSPCLLWIVI